MTEPMTAAYFAKKVDWEGGILEAVDYGLKPEDAPEGPLRDAWAELVAQYALIEPIMRKVQRALDDATGEHCYGDESCRCGCQDGDDDA